MPPETGPETLRLRSDIGPTTDSVDTDEVVTTTDWPADTHRRLFEVDDLREIQADEVAERLRVAFPGSVIVDEAEV